MKQQSTLKSSRGLFEIGAFQKRPSNSPERGAGALSHAVTQALIHAYELNPISRLAPVHHIIVHNNFNTSRKLPCRRSFWHFLNADHLMIAEDAVTVLCFQTMSVFVCCRIDGCAGWESAVHGRITVLAVVEAGGVLAVVHRFEDFWSYQ